MNQRPYREAQSLQERLSDEFHRRCSQASDEPCNHGITDMARKDATDIPAADRQPRARDLAAAATNAISDNSARLDQADCRHRLLEGPNEFRPVRVDRAKKTS
jgi:hypothetical protein